MTGMTDNYIKHWLRERFLKEHPYCSAGIDLDTGELIISHVTQKRKFRVKVEEVAYD